MNLKAQILKAAAEYKPAVTKVDSDLGTVYVRSMTGAALSKWQTEIRDNPTFPARGQVIANCLCDENGERIGFSDLEVLQLDRLDTCVTEPIIDAAYRASGLAKEERAEVEKKSGGQTSDSG
jgi:hypothetical protein